MIRIRIYCHFENSNLIWYLQKTSLLEISFCQYFWFQNNKVRAMDVSKCNIFNGLWKLMANHRTHAGLHKNIDCLSYKTAFFNIGRTLFFLFRRVSFTAKHCTSDGKHHWCEWQFSNHHTKLLCCECKREFTVWSKCPTGRYITFINNLDLDLRFKDVPDESQLIMKMIQLFRIEAHFR